MILIIANARIKGGLSGGDNIYLNLAKYGGLTRIRTMMNIDFRPFALCYITKIIFGCWRALWDSASYEFVYSASDFLMDSLPAAIYKMRGCKWVAGFYLFAPRTTFLYYWSQKIVRAIINRHADVVCITNETMATFDKPMIPVYGGVDLRLAYPDNSVRHKYDAVFIGRLHHTKGIKELIMIWNRVLRAKPGARLAVIGDGDGLAYWFKKWASETSSVHWYGFLDKERFDVYRQSSVVIYPTPNRFSHFSMGPIEAMACGCPMVAFDIDAMRALKPQGTETCKSIYYFARAIVRGVNKRDEAIAYAKTWDWDVRVPGIIKQIRGYL